MLRPITPSPIQPIRVFPGSTLMALHHSGGLGWLLPRTGESGGWHSAAHTRGSQGSSRSGPARPANGNHTAERHFLPQNDRMSHKFQSDHVLNGRQGVWGTLIASRSSILLGLYKRPSD